MGDAILGRYFAAESPVHDLDPRCKLTLMILVMVAIFAAGNYVALGLCAAFLLAFFLASRIPLGQALRSILPLLFMVVITALLNLFFVQGGQVYAQLGPVAVSHDGVHAAVFLGLRLTLLLLAASLLTLTTTTLDLTDAIEDMLRPFARFGLPAHEFSMIMGIALRFLPQFVSELRTIRAAQLSRGATFTTNPFRGGLSGLTSLMVPLFTSAFRHAETLSQAMDARCYHGGVGRTKLAPLAFAPRDGVALGIVLAMIAASIAASVLL